MKKKIIMKKWKNKFKLLNYFYMFILNYFTYFFIIIIRLNNFKLFQFFEQF